MTDREYDKFKKQFPKHKIYPPTEPRFLEVEKEESVIELYAGRSCCEFQLSEKQKEILSQNILSGSQIYITSKIDKSYDYHNDTDNFSHTISIIKKYRDEEKTRLSKEKYDKEMLVFKKELKEWQKIEKLRKQADKKDTENDELELLSRLQKKYKKD